MIWSSRVRRVVACLTLASFMTACYVERPVTAVAPAAQTRIVAQVTDSGVVAMANAIGPGAVEVEAVVAEADASVWKLQLVRVEQRGGTSTQWNREVVTFPRNALTNARAKTLDRKRSWLAASLIAAGVVLAAVVFGAVLTGDSPDENPVPPT
jgi:hypothetical protein